MRSTPGVPRFRRRSRSAGWTIALIVILLALRFYRNQEDARTTTRVPPPSSTEPAGDAVLARVQRVVDGDTLLLVGGERVRLIGIDTPESVKPDTPPEPFGKEASEFTKKLAEGHEVRLEFDRHREDQYGRTLAYVYLGDLLLNEEIVRQGLSRAETRFHFRSDFQKRFLAAEQEARDAHRGIWSVGQQQPEHK